MEDFKVKELLKEIWNYKLLIILISILIAIGGTIYNLQEVKKTNYTAKANIVIICKEGVIMEKIKKINNTYIFLLKTVAVKDKNIIVENIPNTDIISIETKAMEYSIAEKKISEYIDYTNSEIQKTYKANIVDIVYLDKVKINKNVELNILIRVLIYLITGIIFSLFIITLKYCTK